MGSTLKVKSVSKCCFHKAVPGIKLLHIVYSYKSIYYVSAIYRSFRASVYVITNYDMFKCKFLFLITKEKDNKKYLFCETG